MKVYPDNRTVYFDVDETLVMWNPGPNSIVDVYVDGRPGVAHAAHIDIVKRHRLRGSVVVVWSNNGSLWARKVVTALGLTPYVDIVITKPDTYFDDMDAAAFMGKRVYLEHNINALPWEPEDTTSHDIRGAVSALEKL